MMFWILAAVLAAGVAYVVNRPLVAATTHEPASASDADVQVYKDQLAELDADVARGLLTADEAAAARTEVARRILRQSAMVPAVEGTQSGAAARADGQSAGDIAQNNQPVPSPAGGWFNAALVGLPVATLGLYLFYGAPGMADLPLSARLAAPVENAAASDLVAKVEAQLRAHPDDGKGWDVIAPVYMSMGRFADAAEAFANSLKLNGETPARLEGFAKASIRADKGIVSEQAKSALNRALELDPQRLEPKLWLALAAEQDGRIDDAKAAYRALLDAAPADTPWRPALIERLAALDQPQGAAGAGTADGTRPPETAGAPPASGSAAGLSTDERAMVDRMVSGLAERLKADGNNLEGWLRLARAYKVLGRDDDARQAIASARQAFASDEKALSAIAALARDIGLGS
ncbi:MAG: c-type cytochrome biogenesis protein CcmI [Hyphomicrobium sp.]